MSQADRDEIEPTRPRSEPLRRQTKGLRLALGIRIRRVGAQPGLDLDCHQPVRPAHEQVDLPSSPPEVPGDDDGAPLLEEASGESLAQPGDALVG